MNNKITIIKYFLKKNNIDDDPYNYDLDYGKYEFHGVSMKSSKSPMFYRNTITELAKLIIDKTNVNDLIKRAKELYSLEEFNLTDFVQTTKITKYNNDILEERKDVDSSMIYKNPNALQPALMARMKKYFDKILLPDDSVDYVKVKFNYQIKEEDINLEEFRKNIYNVKNGVIYSIMLNNYLNLPDDKLIKGINNLFCDIKLIKNINIDPNLIENEDYKNLYIERSKKRFNIEIACILNRIIFDIIFDKFIYNKYIHGGYVLISEIEDKSQLDLKYYKGMMLTLLNIFQLDPYTLNEKYGISLDEWDSTIKPKRKKQKEDIKDKYAKIREELKKKGII